MTSRARSPRILAVAVAVAALIALAASGASGRTRHPTKTLWATINVCNSAHPKLGIRGQIPGDGTHEQMYMRFTAQFRGSSGWQGLGGQGRSPWVRAGSAFTKFQQIGWTFGLSRPPKGVSYVLRGYVEFEWRSKKHGHTVVARRAHTVTEGGHPRTTGARPRNFSAATCRISG